MTNRTVDDRNDGDKLFETVSDGQGANLYEKADRKRKRAGKENDEDSIESTKCDKVATENLKTKKHKKERNYKDSSPAVQQDITMKDSEYASKGKTKKIKIVGYGSNAMQDEIYCSENGKKKKMKSVENGSNDHPTPNRGDKKVRFSSENEVFTLPSNFDTRNESDNLLRGKRFTIEEDDILKEAVYKYVEEHNLGDEGLGMILNSRKYNAKVKGCWKEIASAIPYRPYTSSYDRAQNLFRRSEDRKWTKEECELILKHQAVHGNRWKPLADALGKNMWQVRRTWCNIRFSNLKKGKWSSEEYQKLFDLVNTDLQAKVSEEKRSKHGLLQDNICWTAISERLSTRSHSTCCLKWYGQLTSPMVAEGVWADVDDYRIISALYNLDATCTEAVDWDGLLDDRTGDLCRKRWHQMVRHIGRLENMSFVEQVEVLTHRYCPHLLEARETWDNKPRVP